MSSVVSQPQDPIKVFISHSSERSAFDAMRNFLAGKDFDEATRVASEN